MMKYNTATLGSGLRVIHLPASSPVVYCGIGIPAGSRHERDGEEGMAHFCEHVTFKGTRRRSALQILNCLERVGGDLNAFTNKEHTFYHAAILREHLSRAVDLLCDIVFCSEYPEHEIIHERDVICDEIESYNDSPAELIYDEFENFIFNGHPLGHNILGTREQVLRFTGADAQRFTRRHYRPSNAIFFAYGDVDFGRLVRMLEEKEALKYEVQDTYGDSDKSILEPRTISPVPTEETITIHKGTHQTHVMLGSRAYPFCDERRMPLYLLNNLLGGPAMNARLNLSLRERHGLVYTVESYLSAYSDAGCWSVYFGCDHHDVGRCLRLVSRELDRLIQNPLSPRQLSAAKQQLKGQIAIGCDNREQFAVDFAKSFLHYDEERHIDELFQRIDAISAEQLLAVAQDVFAPEHLRKLIID